MRKNVREPCRLNPNKIDFPPFGVTFYCAQGLCQQLGFLGDHAVQVIEPQPPACLHAHWASSLALGISF